MLSQISKVDAPALISCPDVVRAELIARSIHSSSPRCSSSLVVLDCAAVPESLAQSELFGFRKNVFAGPSVVRPGVMERADSGTLFLGNVGCLTDACQTQLVHVLEGYPWNRVGDDDPVRVDVRIVASDPDLASRVSAGDFRSDLYFRLRVIEVDDPKVIEV